MSKIIFIFVVALFLLVNVSACKYFETTPLPTEVYMSHYEAELKKDTVTIKRNLSNDSVKLLKKTSQKLNLDEEDLIENSLGISKGGFPKIRNEKINGDTGTIETKNDLTGELDETPFVKEDGRWKIDLKKLIEDSVKKFNDNAT